MASRGESSTARIRKPGCTPCRERHLKCDRELPVCSSCRRARYPLRCEYAPSNTLKLRPSIYSSQIANNPRLPVPQVQGTVAVGQPGDPDGFYPNEQQQQHEPQQQHYRRTSSGVTSFGGGLLSSSPSESFTPSSLLNPQDVESVGSRSRSSGRTSSLVGSIDEQQQQPPFLSPISLSGNVVPLASIVSPAPTSIEPVPSIPPIVSARRVITDSIDAKVFGFYVRTAGPWLDIVSPSRHFGETVPRVALESDPALLYACLAYSARVLTLRGELDQARGESYEDQAIAALIPRLSTSVEPSRNDVLPATLVILRMSEQFSEIRDDARRHLQGASSLFSSSQSFPDSDADDGNSSLRTAAFWVYIRQSIRAAFLNEEPCELDAAARSPSDRMGGPSATTTDAASPASSRRRRSSLDVKVSFTPAPDAVWTNRVTYLLARTCSACWDRSLDPGARLDLLGHLGQQLEQWRRSIPDTFQPWGRFREEGSHVGGSESENPFPVICFIGAWHIIGWQYYYATKVLIGLYRRPKEMNVFEISRYMESEVLAPSRLLCAITFSTEDEGACINGTHLVSWCGQVLSGKEEQRRLLAFLRDFMHETKWPNQTCCDRLERIWSGESREWAS